MLDEKDRQKKLDEYLAGIRKTIADSSRLLSQVELRIAETDRLLERAGLTREQVMRMRFSDEQIEAVNAELARRGMPPVDPDDFAATPEPGGESAPGAPGGLPAADAGETAARSAKFGMMMKPFRI